MYTVYVALTVELTVSVDVPVPPLVRARPDGLKDAVRPVGETLAARETIPEKPERLVIVTVDLAEEPDCTVMVEGLAEALKSGGLNGRRLANLTFDGVEVPSTYKRSSVELVPVGLRLKT